MKVAIGYEIVDGPWGGGNAFVKSMSDWLQERGHIVIDHLDDPHIDIIMMIDPRSYLQGYTFSAHEVWRYQQDVNPEAISIHRINECDERKNTNNMNFWLRSANYAADHTVFIADWLRPLNLWRQDNQDSSTTIFNGGDDRLFHPRDHQTTTNEPIHLVTHHWGGNWMKGFDIYSIIDQMLAQDEWKERFDFTYIGNVPEDFRFKHAHHLAPMSGEPLAQALAGFDGYVTGSICEPGGMHHVEAGLTRLPLLYRNSGALPEYCKGFGQIFEGPEDFEKALVQYLDNWTVHKEAMKNYPWTTERMCGEYTALMESLHKNRKHIVAARRPWRDPIAVGLNFALDKAPLVQNIKSRLRTFSHVGN